MARKGAGNCGSSRSLCPASGWREQWRDARLSQQGAGQDHVRQNRLTSPNFDVVDLDRLPVGSGGGRRHCSPPAGRHKDGTIRSFPSFRWAMEWSPRDGVGTLVLRKDAREFLGHLFSRRRRRGGRRRRLIGIEHGDDRFGQIVFDLTRMFFPFGNRLAQGFYFPLRRA